MKTPYVTHLGMMIVLQVFINGFSLVGNKLVRVTVNLEYGPLTVFLCFSRVSAYIQAYLEQVIGQINCLERNIVLRILFSVF